MLRLNLLFVLLMTFLLAGCNDAKQDYTRYLENPALLGDTLRACQVGKIEGVSCDRAALTKNVMNQFMSQARDLARNEQKFMQMQQQLETSPNDAALQQAASAQEALVNKNFIELQENFAKQIMQEESKLSQLIILQNGLNRALSQSDAKDYEKRAQLLKQLSDAQKLFRITREKVKVMLIFVGLGSRQEG